MIRLENVSFKYRESNKILDNINLNVQDGEIVAIVGKNGSGKSTIGKLIAGILKLKDGNIFIDDLDIKKHQKEIRNRVGVVFQNPENQVIFNSIQDELSFSLKGLSKQEVENRINEALKKVEMSEFKNKELYNLSLGQKQRIMIAEVLAKKPKYIIFDEPTTMIDSLGKEKIYQIIKNLKEQGYTIICITNLADEILLADRTLVLEQGKIVLEIKKEELVEKASELKKYEIKLPTILEILVELQKAGVKVKAKDYTIQELVKHFMTLETENFDTIKKAGGSK